MCTDLPELCLNLDPWHLQSLKCLGLAMVLRPYPAKDSTGGTLVNRQVSRIKGHIESFTLGPFKINTEEHQGSCVKALWAPADALL